MFTAAEQLKCCSKVRDAAAVAAGGEGGGYHTQMNRWNDIEPPSTRIFNVYLSKIKRATAAAAEKKNPPPPTTRSHSSRCWLRLLGPDVVTLPKQLLKLWASPAADSSTPASTAGRKQWQQRPKPSAESRGGVK